MTHTDRQKLYNAIKALREGNVVEIDLHGRRYTVEPYSDQKYLNGYCQDVLCKHGLGRNQEISIVTICWKDAGPNPRLYNSTHGFVPYQNLYGVVRPCTTRAPSSPL